MTWVDAVPEEWAVRPLCRVVTCNDDTLAEIIPGDTRLRYVDISAVDYTAGILQAADVLFSDASSRARRKAQEGDVVVSTVRTYLKAIASVTQQFADCVYSTGFAVLRARQEYVRRDFLKWMMMNELLIQAIEAHSEGLSYPAITAEELTKLKAAVPPLAEQAAIVDFLDRETGRIDALIAKKTRFIELLKEKRQALITHAVTKGLDPNAKMKDSGVVWIGRVPEGWRVGRLKHLLSMPLRYGANESGQDDSSSDVRYIRITDLDQCGNLTDKSARYLPKIIAGPYMLRAGDILLARSGATVGKSYFHAASAAPSCFAGYLIMARPTGELILPEFVINAVRSHYYWAYIEQALIQATIENVSAERYGNFPVATPPLSEQSAIVAFLD